MLLLLVIACYRPTEPAPSGSPSALLAGQTAELARRAELLATQTRDVEGWIDEWKAAPPEQRAAIEAQIQERAEKLQADAEALNLEVQDLEEQARVWDE